LATARFTAVRPYRRRLAVEAKMKRLRRPWATRRLTGAGVLVLAALLGQTLAGCEATRDYPDIGMDDASAADTSGGDGTASDTVSDTASADAANNDATAGSDTSDNSDTTASSDAALPDDATASDSADATADDSAAEDTADDADLADATGDDVAAEDAKLADATAGDAEPAADSVTTDASAGDDTTADALAANQPGAVFPGWQLQDKQPQSPKFGQTYGLAAFAGKATLVSLLSSS